jgi:hypothetical protein
MIKIFVLLNVDATNTMTKRSFRMFQYDIQLFDFLAFQAKPEVTNKGVR